MPWLEGHQGMVKFLVAQRMILDSKDDDGKIALHYAINKPPYLRRPSMA
jgi:ankyrin repeat protein